MVGTQGMVSSSNDGYLHTMGPYLQYRLVRELGPEICQPRTLQGAKGGGRAPWEANGEGATKPLPKTLR